MSSAPPSPVLRASSPSHDRLSSGEASQSNTPSGPHSSGKHVRMVLPRLSEDESRSSGEHGTQTARQESPDDVGDQANPSHKDDTEPANTLEPMMSNEELRNQIAKIFSTHNSSPSESSPKGQSQNQSPPPEKTQRGPKSVLRKGHITPGGSDIPSPPANQHEERSRRKKSEAAEKAQKKAHWWSRSVDTSPEPPLERRSRKHKSSSRYSLFHSGHTLHHDLPGHATPPPDYDAMDYIPRPDRYRVSGLAALTLMERLRGSRRNSFESSDESGLTTPGDVRQIRSQPSSPKRSPLHSRNNSMTHISGLIQSSSTLGGHGYSDIGKARRPDMLSSYTGNSNSMMDTISKFGRGFRSKSEEEVRIKNHVAETVMRHRYLLKLCRALMQYGAPTHRLEQYMSMSARVLETEAQFLYIPGCMIVSFDDSRTHTADVKLVRVSQGVDLGKIADTHNVYKDVVHDFIGVEEAQERLDEIMKRKDKFNRWFRVFMYGIASVGVGPFAFGAQLIDLPIAFLLGCILGFLQLIVAPSSELYSNVFEIVSVIVTSFLARAFGSIPYYKNHDEHLFCFSSLAQSSIALILPGYIVLCGSLELQSRSIIAGSVRLVYAIIYSLFIGYGLTLGTAIYGAIDSNASSDHMCRDPLTGYGYWFLFFVPLFSVCLMIVNQAKWKQMPTMMVLAFAGYCVSYFSSRQFRGNSQVTSTLSALTIGVLANLYSRVGSRVDTLLDGPINYMRTRFRKLTNKVMPESLDCTSSLEKQVDVDNVASSSSSLRHRISGFLHRRQDRHHGSSAHANGAHENHSEKGKKRDRPNYSLASAAMLPAIFVLVPSGLGVSGSLVSGITVANQLTEKNATATNTTDITADQSGLAFNVSYEVVQVAIGITVGLFLGSLFVYPFGKGGKLGNGKSMRSGLFSY